MTEKQFEELSDTFHSFDGNKDGRIVYAEFSKLLLSLRAGLTEEDCRTGFAEIDTDHDGAIAFDEFAVWWARD
jgi:Ca2+-binding EF-hand superfamily protein